MLAGSGGVQVLQLGPEPLPPLPTISDAPGLTQTQDQILSHIPVPTSSPRWPSLPGHAIRGTQAWVTPKEDGSSANAAEAWNSATSGNV